MDYVIASEVPGRLRVRLVGPVPADDLDALYRVLGACPAVERANVYPRIGSIAVRYRAADGARQRVLDHLDAIDAEAIAEARSSCGLELAPRTQSLLMDIAVLVGSYFARRWFLPKPVAALVTAWRYRGFLAAAVRSLGRARLDVPVLDAAAIGMSFVKRDPRTAGETMLLLNLGETLEEYTRSRSEGALVNALLDLPETAQLVEGDQEVQVAASDLKPGDCIAVRTGMPVCVDGEVVRGTAMVNQAALTGEPLAVERGVGDNVFSGTAVEDGEIIVRVTADAGETKLRSIVALVEQAESFKSETQSRMEQLADRIVPWNFLLAGAVALTTRSLVKTSAALMVDYSCALKLTGSIAVLAAMSQSAQAGFTVKGSKHFEAMAAADTIVFDKTGTLTEATPNVACVLALDGWNRREVLRLAACLEEHFPHPVARAVVRAAAEKNLRHRERHADVEYLVAHGIASSLDGKRVVIGSEHFVVEDEGVSLTEEQKRRVADETEGLSPLYLAVDGELIGVIGIEDPLKAGVREAIADLRMLGFKRVVMLTGDGERTAARIADAAGVTEYRANLLPEDKYAFVERLKAEGSKVVMVGDGVNDFEAMAAADTIVFDKTGTLTEATPNVACVLALDGWNRREVLRLAACLEEHFPHPVARAVVRAAAEKNLRHRERHADVEYLVAHGIASSLDGKRVVIGSEHFVVEDEGVSLTEEQKRRVADETEGLSPLYLAVDGELIGVIGIEDPLKAGVREAIADLRMLGFKRVVMLTGDGERTAARIADAAGVTEYRANLLPEDKYAFVERLKAEGSKVVMVGDGVNDAPALSLADVGIAMGQGTAVAKEVADITLTGGHLSALVTLRTLSAGLTARLNASFKEVIAINSALLAAGIGGLITPQTSSLLHNASTVALSVRNGGTYRA